VHDFRQSAIELPIFLQSALIILVRKIRDAVRMMRYQITNFFNSAAPFFLSSVALALVTLVLFRPAAGLAYFFAPPFFDDNSATSRGGGRLLADLVIATHLIRTARKEKEAAPQAVRERSKSPSDCPRSRRMDDAGDRRPRASGIRYRRVPQNGVSSLFKSLSPSANRDACLV
jgi:hypothetical protein